MIGGTVASDDDITVQEALTRAISQARTSGSAESWALVAIALHVTGLRAERDRHGQYRLRRPQPGSGDN